MNPTVWHKKPRLLTQNMQHWQAVVYVSFSSLLPTDWCCALASRGVGLSEMYRRSVELAVSNQWLTYFCSNMSYNFYTTNLLVVWFLSLCRRKMVLSLYLQIVTYRVLNLKKKKVCILVVRINILFLFRY